MILAQATYETSQVLLVCGEALLLGLMWAFLSYGIL